MDIEKLTDRLNAPVQGTGADRLKLALALLWERRDECPGAFPVLVCHDEVVVECDAEQAAEIVADHGIPDACVPMFLPTL
jgi:DNA polymerase I-like protein with 3'-5' exonuclease and polymerase domains